MLLCLALPCSVSVHQTCQAEPSQETARHWPEYLRDKEEKKGPLLTTSKGGRVGAVIRVRAQDRGGPLEGVCGKLLPAREQQCCSPTIYRLTKHSSYTQ
eukprot:585338-Rhodomonas_salina.1